MTLYSLVNQGVYEHVTRAREGGGPHYIPRLHVTEEYIQLYSSVTHNRGIYFYIPQYR
jgi:hypothetical protein